jgi:hypothetical protein
MMISITSASESAGNGAFLPNRRVAHLLASNENDRLIRRRSLSIYLGCRSLVHGFNRDDEKLID